MSRFSLLYSHIEILQQVYESTLTEESPRASQPPHILLPLRPHQLIAIEEMKKKEKNLQQGFWISPKEQLFSRFAILGDPIGVGKTLMVLAHISQLSTDGLRPHVPLPTLYSASLPSVFSLRIEDQTQNLFESLIVVPHGIYRQWQETLTTHTTLKCFFVKTQKDFDKESFVTQLRTSHVTLVSNTLLSPFLTSLRARGLETSTWRRVFYDEADSIKLTNSVLPSAYFTWYITASFENILFPNQFYHSTPIRLLPSSLIEKLHPEVQSLLQRYVDSHPNVTFYRVQSYSAFKDFLSTVHPKRGHLVVRNSSEFLKQSIQLPELLRQVIRCESPVSHRIVESVLPDSIRQMLHAGDIRGALQSLGVPSHTPTTLLSAVTSYRENEIRRLQSLVSTDDQRDRHTEIIERYQAQIHSIRETLNDLSGNACSICYEPPSTVLVSPCCSKLFCGACILQWASQSSQCPMCRVSFHPKDLLQLSETSSSPLQPVPPPRLSKTRALVRLLQQSPPDGQWIVFSRYDSTFEILQEELQELSMPIARIQGNKDHIAKVLEDFQSARIRILLLGSKHAAVGMHIPSATHIILLHKMTHEEENQIIGRAYRFGRTSPLHFIELLHEQE